MAQRPQIPKGLRLRWIVSTLITLGVAVACSSAYAEPPRTGEAAITSPVPRQTSTPTIPPTIHPYPTPTSYATPLPTIVIPMLTRTIPLTTTPEARHEVWQLPERIVPEPFGVEIHFTRASRQEFDYIAAGGFKWVRMDMFWHAIETASGRYNFAEYDSLVKALTERGIRLVFILDYGNPLYDYGFPPTSPAGQDAYARFAAAAARHYRDAGVIWDLWNEPNVDHFWPPEANATQYGQLALKAVAAIRRADPTAIIAAPAMSGYEWPYWHALGRMGLFARVDAVTVHSYGILTPEGLVAPLLELRALINEYSPNYKIPILSGEWGFFTTRDGYTEGQQAQYLSRQWLINVSHDINLNIWYDWRDDGTDPDDPEQNFGTVHNNYTIKPSYQAAQALTGALAGHRFLRRIPLESEDDYLLLFQNVDAEAATVAMAIWTIGDAHTIILPISVGDVAVVEMTADEGTIPSQGQGLAVPISQSPRYLLFRPEQAATHLGGWRPVDTVNCLEQNAEATIPIIFEYYNGVSLYGDLQVWMQGSLRGVLPVSIAPMTREQVAVPIDLDGLVGNVPAEIHLVLTDPVMAPLQRAAVWVQVAVP